jgi:hypothetical protein
MSETKKTSILINKMKEKYNGYQKPEKAQNSTVLNHYDLIVPLGYICNVPTLLQAFQVRQKAYVFDRMATPMWAINELFQNTFQNLLESLETKKLFEDSEKEFLQFVLIILRVKDWNNLRRKLPIEKIELLMI